MVDIFNNFDLICKISRYCQQILHIICFIKQIIYVYGMQVLGYRSGQPNCISSTHSFPSPIVISDWFLKFKIKFPVILNEILEMNQYYKQ